MVRHALVLTAPLLALSASVGDARLVGGVLGANATSYCEHGRMADGHQTYPGVAASNRHPLGTRIRIVGRTAGPGGRRSYVIRDRIGWGSDLDLWTGSCTGARQFGRRNVSYRLVK